MGFLGITINAADLIALFQEKVDKVPQLGINLIDGIAEDVRSEMVNEAPFRWGDLKKFHTIEELSEWIREIFSDVPYFDYVVGGTRPHTIEAKNAKALGPFIFSTYQGQRIGGYVRKSKGIDGLSFFKSVQHPGTVPNDYPSRALESAETRMESRIQDFLDQVVD